MTFEVIVKEGTPKESKSPLKKGQVLTVYHVFWHQATTVEGRGFIFFLIWNPSTDRFIYEDQQAFRPRYAESDDAQKEPQAH